MISTNSGLNISDMAGGFDPPPYNWLNLGKIHRVFLLGLRWAIKALLIVIVENHKGKNIIVFPGKTTNTTVSRSHICFVCSAKTSAARLRGKRRRTSWHLISSPADHHQRNAGMKNRQWQVKRMKQNRV